MKWKKILRGIITFFFLALFLLSTYMLFTYFSDSRKQEAAFNELVRMVEWGQKDLDVEIEADPATPVHSSEIVNSEILPENMRHPGYEVLYAQNPDFFGWVKIEGTKLNYPVMYTPDEPEYYLRRAFDKSPSQSGVPFLDADCTTDCRNYLIYGHNMKNGAMFASLLDYAEPKFCQDHPTIQFDTLTECGTYTVLAAFYSRIYAQEEPSAFRYYQYTDLQDFKLFADYVEQVKAAALYDTGVSAEYGDCLLTLSTCSYHTENGRFVVVAVKK